MVLEIIVWQTDEITFSKRDDRLDVKRQPTTGSIGAVE